jgi:hypothetical protein
MGERGLWRGIIDELTVSNYELRSTYLSRLCVGGVGWVCSVIQIGFESGVYFRLPAALCRSLAERQLQRYLTARSPRPLKDP